MLLDIKLVKESGMDCKEMSYASASRWLGHHYELMYIDAWGFDVSPQLKDVELSTFSEAEQKQLIEKYQYAIGNRVSVGEINSEEYLKSYHGIITEPIQITNKQQCISGILNEITQQLPVALWYDQYFMPWTKEIRKKPPLRYHGYLMITGYDDKQHVFNCIDVHGRREEVTLPLETFEEFIDLYQATNKLYYTTFKPFQKEEPISIEKFVSHTVDRVTGKAPHSQDIFTEMKFLADYIKTTLDFKKEIELSQLYVGELAAPTHILCARGFVRVGRMRNLYALALDYLGKYYQQPALIQLRDQFRLYSTEWREIVSIMVKAFYKKDYYSLNVEIAQRINRIAAKEEQVIDKLIALSKMAQSDISSRLKVRTKQQEKGKYVSCDLTDHLNNRAFAYQTLPNKQANFDGLGNYYVLPKVQLQLVESDDVPYLTYLNLSENDNVICEGQYVTVEEGSYTTIHIMGACDTGGFFGELEVLYEDGVKEQAVFGLGEWRFEMCEFQEKVAFQCERVYLNKIDQQQKGYIFTQTLQLEHMGIIQKIRLPQCANMHIFAITLMK